VGRYVTAALGPSRALTTHYRSPAPGTVYFDIHSTHVRDILPRHSDFTHCVLLSAEPQIDACKLDPDGSRKLNVTAAISVISQLNVLGIRPVFASTEYVYDGDTGNYTEGDAPAPATLYGQQKLEVERHMTAHAPGGLILRLAKVYGSDPGDRSILTGWLKEIREGRTITAARDQVFSPVHAADVAQAVVALIDRNLAGTFNVAGPEAYTRSGMLRRLASSLALPASIRECSLADLTFADRRPFNLSMSAVKIVEATGLRFRTVRKSCDELAAALRAGAAA
jgi:dTDP-4-dehydrorhamnose reductase